jgi:asparagine synthase (glutamine-hydrolysing)
MCGICGFAHKTEQPADTTLLRAMMGTLVHRGPDGEGMAAHDNAALGMRRLSIIDVAGSPQPLYNEDRRIVLVFNGEIFNYRELRENLSGDGHLLRTGGDGETIAHLYEECGTDTPRHLRGQFAFALHDTRAKKLLLARDHTGEKPLYYYQDARIIVFASEIKALLQHPAVPRVSALSDPQQLALYLGYGYMPAPYTAFQGIHALLPGHYLLVDLTKPDLATPQPYWQMPPIADEQPNATIFDYEDRLKQLLAEAVRLRLISDVPLGAFLSGGLDSSLIVAMMQQQNQTVKTFSIGFVGETTYDETPYAQKVAQHLETEHTAFMVEPEALSLLPKLVWHYDQPFADSSAIPTYLVSQLTRASVTVALTGDGGDELFAGYERFYAASMMQRYQRVPRPVWQAAAAVIGTLPEGTDYYNPVKRAGRFARGISQPTALAYFDWVRLFNADTIRALTGSDDAAGRDFVQHLVANGGKPTLPAILHANMTTYLPDDLLIKTDRCSMAVSLEARAPLMDAPLIEFVAQIPFNLKLRGKTLKYALKEVARGLLPNDIIDRKKHGFGVPLGAWLRRDMPTVRATLLEDSARQRNLLNRAAVERVISEHEAGKRDHGQRLWTLLTLEWWHRLFMDATTLTAP